MSGLLGGGSSQGGSLGSLLGGTSPDSAFGGTGSGGGGSSGFDMSQLFDPMSFMGSYGDPVTQSQANTPPPAPQVDPSTGAPQSPGAGQQSGPTGTGSGNNDLLSGLKSLFGNTFAAQQPQQQKQPSDQDTQPNAASWFSTPKSKVPTPVARPPGADADWSQYNKPFGSITDPDAHRRPPSTSTEIVNPNPPPDPQPVPPAPTPQPQPPAPQPPAPQPTQMRPDESAINTPVPTPVTPPEQSYRPEDDPQVTRPEAVSIPRPRPAQADANIPPAARPTSGQGTPQQGTPQQGGGQQQINPFEHLMQMLFGGNGNMLQTLLGLATMLPAGYGGRHGRFGRFGGGFGRHGGFGGRFGGHPGFGGGFGGHGYHGGPNIRAPWLEHGQRAPRGTDPRSYPQAPRGSRFIPGKGLVDAQGNRLEERRDGSRDTKKPQFSTASGRKSVQTSREGPVSGPDLPSGGGGSLDPFTQNTASWITPQSGTTDQIAQGSASGAYPQGANYMSGPLPSSDQMTPVSVGGMTAMVNPRAAPSFQGFLDGLRQAGAPIRSLGGYNRRNIAGSRRWSQHAYGNAIDIDENNAQELVRWKNASPQNEATFRDLQRRYNIRWGGDWSSRYNDPMHVEWAGPQQRADNVNNIMMAG